MGQSGNLGDFTDPMHQGFRQLRTFGQQEFSVSTAQVFRQHRARHQRLKGNAPWGIGERENRVGGRRIEMKRSESRRRHIRPARLESPRGSQPIANALQQHGLRHGFYDEGVDIQLKRGRKQRGYRCTR